MNHFQWFYQNIVKVCTRFNSKPMALFSNLLSSLMSNQNINLIAKNLKQVHQQKFIVLTLINKCLKLVILAGKINHELFNSGNSKLITY